MKIINNNMKWIMFFSGVLTFTMIFAAIEPQEVLNSMYGESLKGPLAEMIVRNWAVLIALIGGMLIYGAFNQEVRQLVLVVAVLSKMTFIALVIIYGFGHKLIIPILFDGILILLFSSYLFFNEKDYFY